MPLQQDALALEIAALGKREAALLVVCDGIGGLQEGEYASSYVTMRIRDWFYRDFLRHVKGRHGRGRIERDCVGMLYDCNRYLLRYGKERGIRLGTTMTMAILRSRRPLLSCGSPCFAGYQLFHVGDSRAYLLGKRCRRLTGDDSAGDHALHRCIGSFSWQGVQKRRGHLRLGERLLLCSDGFWRKLEEREMAESLGRAKNLPGGGKLTEEQLEKRLYRLGTAGRERGERDNQAAVCILLQPGAARLREEMKGGKNAGNSGGKRKRKQDENRLSGLHLV